MVILGEDAQVEAQFGLFGDSANLDARLVHGLRGTYHMLRNQLGQTRWTVDAPNGTTRGSVSYGISLRSSWR